MQYPRVLFPSESFSFAPNHLLDPFKKDKETHPIAMLPYNHRHKVNLSVSDNNAIAIECEEPCSVGPWDCSFAKGFASTGWPNGRKRSHAGKLLCHMTNFVASHFGWHKGGDLVPSQYLCIEYT